MATLSIGGNDLGFFDVMNACIFRFYSFYSGTCEAALAKAELAIESPDFEHRLFIVLLQILDKAHWEKRPGFSITVTGYARFFDADTALCDDCSMGVWWSGPKLTRAIRNEMNALVLAVNIKLRRTVEAVNARFTRPRVFFVTYDDEFEGHRFCEKNVTEPDYTRDDTWFFTRRRRRQWPERHHAQRHLPQRYRRGHRRVSRPGGSHVAAVAASESRHVFGARPTPRRLGANWLSATWLWPSSETRRSSRLTTGSGPRTRCGTSRRTTERRSTPALAGTRSYETRYMRCGRKTGCRSPMALLCYRVTSCNVIGW